jgi:hypothetical protein
MNSATALMTPHNTEGRERLQAITRPLTMNSVTALMTSLNTEGRGRLQAITRPLTMNSATALMTSHTTEGSLLHSKNRKSGRRQN